MQKGNLSILTSTHTYLIREKTILLLPSPDIRSFSTNSLEKRGRGERRERERGRKRRGMYGTVCVCESKCVNPKAVQTVYSRLSSEQAAEPGLERQGERFPC